MTSREQYVAKLAKAIRAKYNSLKRAKRERHENINQIFKPVTKHLSQIVNSLKNPEDTLQLEELENDHELNTRNKEYDDAVSSIHPENPPISHEPNVHNEENETVPECDHDYGPELSNGRWLLGNKHLEYDNNQIIVDGEIFKSTPGLQQLIFSRTPKNFSSTDLLTYKQILELTNVHRDSRGYLKHQSCSTKFENIIKPLFKNTTRKTVRSNISKLSRDLTRVVNKNHKTNEPIRNPVRNSLKSYDILLNWTDPNVLVERLRQLDEEDDEFWEIIAELRQADIIE